VDPIGNSRGEAESLTSQAAYNAENHSLLIVFVDIAACILQYCHMGNTITVRVPRSMATWLQEKAARTGMSQGQIVREQLERVRRTDKGAKKFMRLAGAVRGARDLSARKGFSKT
jgi:hypothetical protein